MNEKEFERFKLGAAKRGECVLCNHKLIGDTCKWCNAWKGHIPKVPLVRSTGCEKYGDQVPISWKENPSDVCGALGPRCYPTDGFCYRDPEMVERMPRRWERAIARSDIADGHGLPGCSPVSSHALCFRMDTECELLESSQGWNIDMSLFDDVNYDLF